MKSIAKLISAGFLVIYLSAGCGGTPSGGLTGTTTGPTLSSAKAITAYRFTSPLAVGTISEATKSIAVTVPNGTAVTALIATFTTTGASVRVGTTTQVSGTTPNDFTLPVVYTVTAADGTSVNYTVTVTVSPPPAQTAKALQAFELAGVAGAINETSKTVSVVLPPDGTDVTALAATFTTSGSFVTVGTTTQVSGVTTNNFSIPVVYTVHALDGSTASYTVSVSFLTAAKLLSSFTVTGMTGIIDQTARTVAVTIPLQPVNALVASFVTTTGAIVKVGSVVQTSGVTVNDFTAPVVYTVIASDGLTVDYTVTVTIAPFSLTSFAFSSVSVTGVIDHTGGSVSAFVPARTAITTLVSTFTTTNAVGVTIGATPQVSGVTANDFTSPVIYTVTGAGAATKDYTVTVTVAPGLLNLARTGQLVGYSASGTNDDGKLQKGVVWPTPRFTPVSSGTGTVVQDNLPGLAWAWDGSTPTVGACTGGPRTWLQALTYITCLNAANYLTYSDWRLPNVNELVSLVTSSQPNTYAWLNSQGTRSVQGNFYYSSTTDPVLTTQARIVNMVTGNAVVGLKTLSLDVLPVRGTPPATGGAPIAATGQTTSYAAGDDGNLQVGVAWPGPRFTDPAGTLLTASTSSLAVDQLTGLMWTRDGDTPGSVTCAMSGTWQGTLDYIACLNTSNYLGYSDWRLPNILEQASLIHAEQTDTSTWLNAQGFLNAQGNPYWSSTTDATVTDNAWVIFMAGGDKDSAAKTASTGFKAWPVRSGF
ncbi:MAG: DUF1566 domain-containing protein [Nitrospirota bacterium]